MKRTLLSQDAGPKDLTGAARRHRCPNSWADATAFILAGLSLLITTEARAADETAPLPMNNPEQKKNSAYARRFQQEGAHTNLTAEGLAFWVKDPAARARYVEAFRRSDFEAMLNYYKCNYPREPYVEDASPVVKVLCPVLMFHGLKDKALLADALNGTWKWVGQDLTLVTVPEADHWVQQDAADLVTRTLVGWLNR